MEGLEQRAMLINFSKGQWTGEAPDKQADKDIQEKRGNKAGTTKTTKFLVEEGELKANNKAFNAAYLFYIANTLPWEPQRGGKRLLPGGNYDRFWSGINSLVEKAEARADEFARIYPELVEKARGDLNGLFNPKNYPSPEIIRSQFRITVSESPLPLSPQSLTLRFMGQERLAALKARLQNSWDEQENKAMGDLFRRLAEAVGHMAKTLADPEAKFKDSLVNNIAEIADMIPALNFRNDPELAELGALAKGTLTNISPDTLRTEMKVRGQMAGAAGELLGKITGAGGRFIDLS